MDLWRTFLWHSREINFLGVAEQISHPADFSLLHPFFAIGESATGHGIFMWH